jgi:hypothetical protein
MSPQRRTNHRKRGTVSKRTAKSLRIRAHTVGRLYGMPSPCPFAPAPSPYATFTAVLQGAHNVGSPAEREPQQRTGGRKSCELAAIHTTDWPSAEGGLPLS